MPAPGERSRLLIADILGVFGNLLIMIGVGMLVYLFFFGPPPLSKTYSEAKILSTNAIFWIVVVFSAFIGIFEILAFASSRQRRIRVFISYNHHYQSRAVELVGAFTKPRYEIFFNPMSRRANDEIVDLVRQQLRKADVVIAIPGDTKESFSNSEILAAAALAKPVILVVESQTSGLAHTALSGYPVFVRRRLSSSSYKPLDKFLMYIFNYHRIELGKWSFFTAKIDPKIFLTFYSSFLLVSLWYGAAPLLTWVFDTNLFVTVGLSMAIAGLGLAILLYIIGVTAMTVLRRRTLRTVRQLAESRRFTYSAVSNVLEREILEAMVAKPLELMSD